MSEEFDGEEFEKQPHEAYIIAVDFADKLPVGASLLSGTLSALNTSTDEDATADVLETTTAVIDETQAQAFVKEGVHGYNYKITFTVLLTPGTPAPTLEDDVLMKVREI